MPMTSGRMAQASASGKGPDGSTSVMAVPFPFSYLTNEIAKWCLLSGFWERFPCLKKKSHKKKSLRDFPFLVWYLDQQQASYSHEIQPWIWKLQTQVQIDLLKITERKMETTLRHHRPADATHSRTMLSPDFS